MISLYINYLLISASVSTGGYGAIFGIAALVFYDLVIAIPIWSGIIKAFSAKGKDQNKTPPPSQTDTKPTTMRCPNCGSPATVHGNSWECGWCGDCGVFR